MGVDPIHYLASILAHSMPNVERVDDGKVLVILIDDALQVGSDVCLVWFIFFLISSKLMLNEFRFDSL